MEGLSESFYRNAYALNKFLTMPAWRKPLLKTAYELLGGPVLMADYAHRIVGEYHEGEIKSERWNQLLSVDDYPMEWIDRTFHESLAALKANKMIHTHIYGVKNWTGMVTRNGVCYGFFSVNEERKELDGDGQELFGLILDIIALRVSETDETALREPFYGPLLRDIVEGKITDRTELEKRMHTRNWTLSPYYAVVAVGTPPRSGYVPPGSYVTKRLTELSRQIIVFEYKSLMFALVEAPSLNYLEAVFELVYAQINSLKLRAGVSETFGGLLDLRQFIRQAATALEYCEQSGVSVNFYEDNKLEDFLAEITEKLPCEHFYHGAYTALAEYDRKNNSALSNTLYHYLLLDKSVTKCGKALHMHKNTVALHIEKIKDITDNNLLDPSDTLHMLLTFELARYQSPG
jgi:hypothetical protein